jgi:hypothetical protein
MTAGSSERDHGGQGPLDQPLPDVEIPFDAPWHARIFATAVVACQQLGLPWDAFRDQLKEAVAADPQRPYYESVTEALEQLTAH